MLSMLEWQEEREERSSCDRNPVLLPVVVLCTLYLMLSMLEWQEEREERSSCDRDPI